MIHLTSKDVFIIGLQALENLGRGNLYVAVIFIPYERTITSPVLNGN